MRSYTNGTAEHEPAAPRMRVSLPTRKTPPAKGKRKAARKPYRPARIAAGAIGGVGTTVLGLSVWHCTEALTTLTGSPPVLAGMLAIGIDAGMVATEIGTVIAKTGPAHAWCRRYVGLAAGLSVLLNGAASAMHAEGWLRVPAAVVGGLIPVLVYMLGSAAAHLWEHQEKP